MAMDIYATAGNPNVDANGAKLTDTSPDSVAAWLARYNNNYALAAQAYASQNNQVLLASGQALQTPQGVVSLTTALQQLIQHGYTGPQDAASVGQAFALLHTSPPATPRVGQPVPGPGSGGISGALSNLPAPALLGGGVLLLLVLGGGRIRL